MIRPVMKMGEPVLLDKAMPVEAFGTPELRKFVADMWETMEAEGGIGIAAPQVGASLQIVCFGNKKSEEAVGEMHVPQTVLINPVVEPVGDEVASIWEGCLSVPGMRGRVTRPADVRYSGYDLEGERIERTVEGMHARVVLHEVDHLHGILYPMRIADWHDFGYSDVLFPKKPEA